MCKIQGQEISHKNRNFLMIQELYKKQIRIPLVRLTLTALRLDIKFLQSIFSAALIYPPPPPTSPIWILFQPLSLLSTVCTYHRMNLKLTYLFDDKCWNHIKLYPDLNTLFFWMIHNGIWRYLVSKQERGNWEVYGLPPRT